MFLFLQPGGLFHPEDDKQEVAFRYAVERVNADRAVLPRAKLLAQVETISPQDSFHASKRGVYFTICVRTDPKVELKFFFI